MPGLPDARHGLEQVVQLVALWTRKLFDQFGKLLGQASPLPCQSREVLEKDLGLGERLVRLDQLLAQPQVAAWVFEKPLPPLLGGLLPRGVEGLDLRAREFVPGDGPGQALTGLGIAASQGNEHLHRGLSGDLALADQILKSEGKLPHQSQAPRDPAGAAHKTSGQFFLAPAKAMLDLGEQPALLQGARGWGMVHLPLQDQGVGFLHLPDQGIDGVVSKTTQDLEAQMAVNDDVAILLVGVRDDDNRLLLTVLVHRRQKPALTLTATSTQLGVGRVELVELQFHGGGSLAQLRWRYPPVFGGLSV